MKIKDGKIIYRRKFRRQEINIADIVWAYLQCENVKANMCWGTANFQIGRLIICDAQGNAEQFQYEGMDKPKELLEIIKKENPKADIGYTEENREKYKELDKTTQTKR